MNSQIEMSEAILVAYIDGTLSPAQMAQVEHWYDASEENRKLFDQLYFILQLHDRTQSVKGISAEQSLAALKAKIAARNGHSGSKKVVSFGRRALRYAAVFTLLAVVTGFIAYLFYDNRQECVVVADNEQNKTVVLPDQSTVVLKGDSKISFSTKFADKRVVYLDGEALFDVVKVADSEFVVKTSDAQIVVKGTKFNFKAYSNSKLIETTLLEGAIDLRTSGHKIAIKPNQKAVYNTETRRMNIVEVDARLEIFGERYFNTERLEYVINSLEHIYNCKISFADQNIKDIRFSGTINRNNSLNHTLNILTLTTGTEYKRYGDAIVISK